MCFVEYFIAQELLRLEFNRWGNVYEVCRAPADFSKCWSVKRPADIIMDTSHFKYFNKSIAAEKFLFHLSIKRFILDIKISLAGEISVRM